MGYAEILQQLGTQGTGIEAFSQGAYASENGHDIGSGVCLGLVTGWLLAPYAKTGASKYKSKNSELGDSLLSSFEKGSVIQFEYEQVNSDFLSMDSNTQSRMADAGFKSKPPVQAMGKDFLASVQSNLIAETVLSHTACRLDICGADEFGEMSGHAIGFRKSTTLFSSWVECFEPNFGFFWVNGKAGVKRAMEAIADEYKDGIMRGQRGYVVFPFSR
jgi:hypothetical protein